MTSQKTAAEETSNPSAKVICAKVFASSLQKPMPPYALDICLVLTGCKSDVERFS